MELRVEASKGFNRASADTAIPGLVVEVVMSGSAAAALLAGMLLQRSRARQPGSPPGDRMIALDAAAAAAVRPS